jgi:antitoxin (DNA-binding transcriptional repressor) of toxin-antitoxin stability system
LEVNGESIRRAAWGESVVVIPGETTVLLLTPGAAPQNRKQSTKAGATWELTLSVPKTRALVGRGPGEEQAAAARTLGTDEVRPDSGPSLRGYAYASGALGLVGFGAFGVFGMMTADSHSKLEDACPDHVCPAEQEQLIEDGKNQRLWANIGLGVGIAASAAAVVLWAVDDPDPDATALVLTPNGVQLRGAL